MTATRARKPKTHHLPEYSTLEAVYTGAEGKTRYRFSIESGSNQADYEYNVNDDGSRPYCDCRIRHPYAAYCRLESPDYAAIMAERGKSINAGKPVPCGY